MSSYYTTAQLEAMRKEQLKTQLAESIRALSAQLLVDHANNVGITAGQNVITFTSDADNGSSGYLFSGTAASAVTENVGQHSKKTVEENDLSGLLRLSRKPAKLEMELQSWIKKVEERAILTEKDEKDKARIISEIKKIAAKTDIDIEDKIYEVSMRVKSFIQGGTPVKNIDREKQKNDYIQYCAICRMLEIEPSKHSPYQIRLETKRLMAILEKKKQDEYIMQVIEKAMEKVGCHLKETVVLDHTLGGLFSVDGNPFCDVFAASDGSGIMFEPIAGSREGSPDKQRQIEKSANSVCSLYSEIEELAAEQDVILRRVYADPVSIDTMCVQSDIKERHEKKHQKKAQKKKLKAAETEA